MFKRNQDSNPLAQYAKAQVKKKMKSLVFAFIKPYIIPIAIFALVFILVSLLISSLYTQLTGGQTLLSMGTEITEKDREIRDYSIHEADRVNKLDLWVDGKKITEFVDAYGRDQKLALTWGHIYAVVSFNEISNQNEITKEVITKTAKDLHPHFYYMESEKTIERYDEEKERWELYTTTTEYLLTKTETIYGNYIYTYDRVTETEDNIRITYNKPVETKLEGVKYQRLREYLKSELKAEDIDIEYQTFLVLEAGKGLDKEREQLEWLIDTQTSSSSFISVSSAPPELMPVIKTMSEKYNIPIWFLCGLIWERSSFDAELINPDNGAIGLMQVGLSDWERLSYKLGYDAEKDKPNPKAQVEIGINILLECMAETETEKVDWDTERLWETQIAPALSLYGGYDSGNTENTYLSKVYKYAREFKTSLRQKTWPVPGYTEITSPFEIRIHPVFNTITHHTGVDIATPIGAEVVSVTKGKVVYASWLNTYGKTVVVRDMIHDYLYAHLSDYNVSVGDEVDVGDALAFTGNTGVTTGPHLHFGISIGNFNEGKWINPLDIINMNQ